VKERLPPAGAVSKLNERVKKIGKVNSDIAEWLQVWAATADSRVRAQSLTCSQERRKVEEAYVTGLRKLSRKPLQEVAGDLGYDICDHPLRYQTDVELAYLIPPGRRSYTQPSP
jgi:F-BAR domain only protein